MRNWTGILLLLILAALALFNHKPAPESVVIPATSTQALATTEPQEATSTATTTLVFTPSTIIQGEPALVAVEGTTSVKSIIWNGKSLGVFTYKGVPSALIGADFNLKSGTYPVVATLSDGTKIKKDFVIGKRIVAEAPLGIPESLGGNTPEAQKELVAELARENTILNTTPTASTTLWHDVFQYPVANPVVTDPYGYDRLTGASTIVHKGTDFHAATGTPVFAMNSGVVRVAREFVDYGNTVVIDHGLGLQTFYMHLSTIYVHEGESVERGKLIALSGQTGYAEGAHLHISVRINNISIDPIKFLDLFK